MSLGINVCFHGVGTPVRGIDQEEAHYWVSRSAFLALLDALAERPAITLSFDDGNASDLEIALPALLERGLTARFFVLAGRLGTAGSLGPSDVRTLLDAGMLIGTHGMDHVSWRGLSDTAAHRELVEARHLIAEVAGPVDEAALPRGQYDRGALHRLRSLGYTRVHTSDRRPARPDAWLQPRFSATHDSTPASLSRATSLPRPLTERVVRGTKTLAKRMR